MKGRKEGRKEGRKGREVCVTGVWKEKSKYDREIRKEGKKERGREGGREGKRKGGRVRWLRKRMKRNESRVEVKGKK